MQRYMLRAWQIDATIKLVLLGVESHEVSSSSFDCLPNASIPRWYAEEGASISINRTESRHPTALYLYWVMWENPHYV